MRWQRFFEDLELQLDSEWEAERAALDTEAERLRLSRLGLRERLVGLIGDDLALEVRAPEPVRGRLTGVGVDWASLDVGDRRGAAIVPIPAVVAIVAAEPDLLRSARPAGARTGLSDRMGLGFVLRDLARRRIGVRLVCDAGRSWSGTIDRAGADHLDLAVHEVGEPRRAAAVTGHRLVAFSAIHVVQLRGEGA